MHALVLNGSPRTDGTVATLLKEIAAGLGNGDIVEWVDVCDLDMANCTACMACRERGTCVLPTDDAHRIGARIAAADALVVGTPVHWGNMCAPLKLLFDRNVPVFMNESPKGMPVPQQQGKPTVLATACTTPWPLNWILPQSRGALRAVKAILRSGGCKVLGSAVKAGTRKSSEIPQRLQRKARRLGEKLADYSRTA